MSWIKVLGENGEEVLVNKAHIQMMRVAGEGLYMLASSASLLFVKGEAADRLWRDLCAEAAESALTVASA